MKKNMDDIDKIIRLTLALIIFGSAFADLFSGILQIIILSIAGVFILTSLFGFCPLYLLFKINTLEKKTEGDENPGSKV